MSIDNFSLKEKMFYLAITDKQFYSYISDVFVEDSFDLQQEKFLVNKINQLYAKYNQLSLNILLDKLNIDCELLVGADKILANMSRDIVNKIMSIELNESERKFVKNEAVNFLKQKNLKNNLTNFVESNIIESNYDKAIDLLNNIIAKGNKNIDVNNIGVLYSKDVDNLDVKRKNIVPAFDEFNQITDGGIAAGELSFVIGSPGVGKSHFLVNIGYLAAIAGKNVFHYTLELSEETIVVRYDSRFFDMPINEVINLSSATRRQYYDRIKKIYNNMGHIIVKSFGTGMASVYDIKNHIDKCMVLYNIKPDIIIVDYDELLKVNDNEQFRMAMRKIYIQLRQLACTCGCAVWTASQTNRGGAQKTIVDMDDVAEDFSKIKTSDFVVSLAKHQNDTIYIKNIKNRMGPDKFIWKGKIDTSKSKIILMSRIDNTADYLSEYKVIKSIFEASTVSD